MLSLFSVVLTGVVACPLPCSTECYIVLRRCEASLILLIAVGDTMLYYCSSPKGIHCLSPRG